MKTTMSQGETVSHTPTPWRAIECAGIDHDGSVAWDIEIDGHTVAHVYPGENMDEDAQFIVQAVNCHDDLLEACKVALSRLHHYTDGMESCDMPVKDEMAIADLESAIDRATKKEGAK